jgi:hypothetical protein
MSARVAAESGLFFDLGHILEAYWHDLCPSHGQESHQYGRTDVTTTSLEGTRSISICAPGKDTFIQCYTLAFEGPDVYAQAGGIASRVTGLTEALAAAGFAVHLWFRSLRANPSYERGLRQAGQVTARHYAWSRIVHHLLMLRLEFETDSVPPFNPPLSLSPWDQGIAS